MRTVAPDLSYSPSFSPDAPRGTHSGFLPRHRAVLAAAKRTCIWLALPGIKPFTLMRKRAISPSVYLFVAALLSVSLFGASQQSKAAAGAQAAKDANPPSASLTFAVLKDIAARKAPDKTEWEDSLKSLHLTLNKDAIWHLQADDGEVRAFGFFSGTEKSLHLLYFPVPIGPFERRSPLVAISELLCVCI